ncbi:MAG: 1-acyl-sn-glycerol-3-phosphate acyltransferase [Chitinophagaceae bacterium]
MLYRFAWVLMWITFKIYFRRIDVIGLEKIDPQKPSILVANHPASFLDAMVLAVFLKRNVHFYVRGDIFKHPIVYKIFTWLHMIPIFSRDHGMENVGKNFATFERGKQLLQKGHLLLIFPEGFSRLSKKIEPMKKGAARVALQTAFEDEGGDDLSIQSIAINYSFHGIKSDLYISVGDSLQLNTYKNVYHELPAKAVSQLTSDLLPFFERNIIHVKDGNRTLLVEQVLRLAYNDCLDNPSVFFEKARAICNKIDEKSDLLYHDYSVVINRYQNLLTSYQINDRAFSKNPVLLGPTLLNLIATIEIFVIGKLFWFLPGRITKWIADKTVTRIDFYTSVTAGVLAFVCLIWWISALVLSNVFHSGILTLSIFCMPVIAYFTLKWEYDYKDLAATLRARKLKNENPDLFFELFSLRNQILN